MKRNLLLGVACLLGLSAVAQQDPVLMRVNGKDVPRSEFEAAYHKEKSLAGAGTLTPAEYVDRFVNHKLKLSAAESAGMDTARVFREELARHRAKLAISYLTDKDSEDAAARRAYERNSASRTGQVQVMQIFISLPQTVLSTRVRAAETRMDSVYAALKHSNDATFAAFVKKHSEDKEKFWVSRLQTPEEFENVVFSLQQGEISRPFYSPQGLHIVKVIDRKENASFEEAEEERRRRLASRQEIDKSTEALVQKLKSEYAYTPDAAGVEELLSKGETGRSLFTLNGRTYSGAEFKRFAAGYPRGVKLQLDAFVAKTILEIENARLDQKHPDLHLRLQEHRDNLLLSQITARELGPKALADEAGLSTYFKFHRSDYDWERPRYRGIVLHCANKKSIGRAKKRIKKLPEDQWVATLKEAFNTPSQENVQIEQGLFAEGDNKYVDKLVFKKGSFEPLESYPFTAVLGEKQKGPDSYKEVRGPLTADYRNFLESLWVKRLRAAGKVEINQEVLKTVNNH